MKPHGPPLFGALALRWRLAALFTLGFGVLLGAGGIALHSWLVRGYRAQFDAELEASIVALRELHEQELAYFPDAWSAAEHAVQELLFPDRVFVALRSDGTMATSRGLDLASRLTPRLSGLAVDSLVDVTVDGLPFRAAHRPLASDVSAFVVLSRRPLEDRISRLSATLGVGLPLILLVGGLIGAVGAQGALRPVMRLADAAEVVADEVAAGEDSFTHMPTSPADDEVGRLTSAVDRLVDRLGPALRKERALVDRQRKFLASAAHELRMPVTILRSEAEVALEATSDRATEREALQRIAGEAAQLSALVDDLMLLARAESARPHLRPEPLFMDDIAAETIQRLGRHPSARGRRLLLEDFEPAPVVGDPVLIERALGVLIHNALVHAAPSNVVLRAGSDDEHSWVDVVDEGPGIPGEAAERVFDRFVRLDSTRPGTGLGLPIARWIADLHGGSLELASTEGAGARFTLRLPAASARATD